MFDTGVSAGMRTVGDAGAEVDSAALHAAAWGAGVSDQVVAGLSAAAACCRVAENVARARLVETVCEMAEIRFVDAGCGDGDPLEVSREVVCEVAAALRVTQMVARPLVETGLGLDRLPLTALRLMWGSLDWGRVVVIESVLGKASDTTVRALEFEAVAAAERLGARALRLSLWRMWMEFDAEEASAARAVAVKGERGVWVRRDGGGVSQMKVTMTDVEGAEAEALIEEMVGSVCPHDPRSAKELRVDALLGLLHGEHALECRCDRGEECPRFGMVDAPDGRRGALLQILIDVQTLLGLSRNPAVLADGTALDAEAARILAQDATWQALLVELAGSDVARAASAAAQSRKTGTDAADGCTDSASSELNGVADGTDNPSRANSESFVGEGLDDEKPGDDGSDGDRPDSEGPGVAGETKSSETTSGGAGLRLWRLVFKGRTRSAGAVPTVRTRRNSATHDQYGSPRAPRYGTGVFGYGNRTETGTISGTSGEYARAQLIAALTAAIDADPGLAAGTHPDGHGGHRRPPVGALTYRPSSEVADRVRMTYSTCTHPGCEKPSTRCELDHIVPFDHKNPLRGGWTVDENLHPVCKSHHQLKTRKAWTTVMLAAGAILWISPAGIREITLPRLGLPTPPRSRKRRRKAAITDTDSPTWWETNMPADAAPPTRSDLAAAASDAARAKMRSIRREFREHNRIRELRAENEPPPF